MFANLVRGAVAGAAGTTALNAATYLDMALRARPASETPQHAVDEIARRSGHPVPGDGSCIFLHKWTNSSTGTAGCTAMPAENIEAIVDWLNPKDRAVLVQLPESEYQRLQKEWRLP